MRSFNEWELENEMAFYVFTWGAEEAFRGKKEGRIMEIAARVYEG